MATPTYEVAQKRITNLDNSILEVSVTSSGSHRVKRKVLRYETWRYMMYYYIMWWCYMM